MSQKYGPMTREEIGQALNEANNRLADNMAKLPNWTLRLFRILNEDIATVESGGWPRESVLSLAMAINNKEHEVAEPNRHLKLNWTEDTGKALDDFLAESEANEKGQPADDGPDKRS